MSTKVYVKVISVTKEDGQMVPQALYWENGTRYDIDKVTDVRQAAAIRAGGTGERFTIWVNGKQTYLYFERNASPTECNIGRWFVERKGA